MEFLSVGTVPIALIWARHSASAGAASPRIRRFAFTFTSRFVGPAVIGLRFGNRTVASSAWPPCGAASRCGLPGGARDVGGDDVGGRSGRGELAGRLHHYAEGRVAATWAARSGHCWADGDRRVHWSHGPVGGGKSA